MIRDDFWQRLNCCLTIVVWNKLGESLSLIFLLQTDILFCIIKLLALYTREC